MIEVEHRLAFGPLAALILAAGMSKVSRTSTSAFICSCALQAAGDGAGAAAESATTERLRKEQQRITDMRQSLVQNPNDMDLRCEFARFLIEHGHAQEGLEWALLILKQKPGDPKTSRLLVEYYSKQGDMGLANFYRLNAAPAPPRS